jgi:hypothetical protein
MPKIDGRKLDHGTSEHIRILAVRRVREDGESPSDVMDSLRLCRTTIYPWLRRYDKEGLDALKASKAKGPASKLSDKQKQKVRGWIEMLELHFIPPYAPDLNPDDFVWQHVKTNGPQSRSEWVTASDL